MTNLRFEPRVEIIPKFSFFLPLYYILHVLKPSPHYPTASLPYRPKGQVNISSFLAKWANDSIEPQNCREIWGKGRKPSWSQNLRSTTEEGGTYRQPKFLSGFIKTHLPQFVPNSRQSRLSPAAIFRRKTKENLSEKCTEREEGRKTGRERRKDRG